MFVIINYVLTVNLLLFNYAEASSRVCRKLKHGIEDNLRYESVQDIGTNQCPPTTAPFSVYKVATGSNNSEHQCKWFFRITFFFLNYDIFTTRLFFNKPQEFILVSEHFAVSTKKGIKKYILMKRVCSSRILIYRFCFNQVFYVSIIQFPTSVCFLFTLIRIFPSIDHSLKILFSWCL